MSSTKRPRPVSSRESSLRATDAPTIDVTVPSSSISCVPRPSRGVLDSGSSFGRAGSRTREHQRGGEASVAASEHERGVGGDQPRLSRDQVHTLVDPVGFFVCCWWFFL